MQWESSILTAINYIVQAIVAVFTNLEFDWTIGTLNNGETDVTIGTILLWYSCLIIGMIIIMRLLGGASNGGKKNA